MAIRLQILHGNDAPTEDNLLPYELGWSINNKSLYIGSSDGYAPIQLTYGVGALPVENGGTGATTAEDAAKNLGFVPKTGGAFTGILNLQANTVLKAQGNYYHLYFFDQNNNNDFAIISERNDSTGVGRFHLRQWFSTTANQKSDKYEDYTLPSVEPENSPTYKYYSILTTKKLVSVAQGGTGANTAADARTNLMAAHSLVSRTNYFGLIHNDGSEGAFIRTTQDGIIPYSADSENGKSYVGTSGWPFQAMYAKNFYGNVTGNVTGNITGKHYFTTNGCTWDSAKNYAMIKPSYTWVSSSQYIPIFSCPTHSGDWSIGTYQDGSEYHERLFFVYAGADSTNNSNHKKYYIDTEGKFSGTIDWSHINDAPFNNDNILPVSSGGTGASSSSGARTNLGLDKLVTYTMGEVDTGKIWVDNKPIYRCIKTLTGITASNNQSTKVNLDGIPDTLVDLKVFVKNSIGTDNEGWRPIPNSYYADNTWACNIYLKGSEVTIGFGSKWSTSDPRTILIIAEYTK